MERQLDITLIPFDDIRLYLANNTIFIPKSRIKAYDTAKYLLDVGNVNGATDAILDWLIAKDIISQNIRLPQYTLSFISNASKDDLLELSFELGLDVIDKQRIIRILSYLGVLMNDVGGYVNINLTSDPDKIIAADLLE